MQRVSPDLEPGLASLYPVAVLCKLSSPLPDGGRSKLNKTYRRPLRSQRIPKFRDYLTHCKPLHASISTNFAYEQDVG
jgi:hypothetical protein